MSTGRTRGKLESLDYEKKAKAEAILARLHGPKAKAAEVADRQALGEEYRSTGTIEATDEPIDVDTILRLKQLLSRLKAHRENQGVTLATLSLKSGIDVPALSRLENGLGNPTFATLTRYAAALGAVLKLDFEVIPS